MAISQKQFFRYSILLVLLLGFGLRVALVVQGQPLQIKWDEKAYVRRAERIIENPFQYRDLLRAPVYPAFLAGVSHIAGSSRFSAGILQALLSTFLIAAIFTLSRVLFARRDVALLAALFTALYLEFITLARLFMSETLFITLSVFGVTILFHALKRERAWEFLAAGVVLALAAQTRELLSYFAVLVLPVWLAFVSLKQPRPMLLHVAALVLGLSIVFVPWVTRNWNLEGRLILSTTHSEIDLLRDNWRIELAAQGAPLTDAEGAEMKSRVRRELAAQPRSERSMFVLRRAFEAMFNYPREWIQDKFSRLEAFWLPFALQARVVRLENIEPAWRDVLQGVVSYSAVALLLLGTFGMLLARDDAPKLLIALYILYSLVIFLMTHYLPRFRLPLLIFLIPYAAFAMFKLGEWLRAPNAHIFLKYPARTFACVILLGLFAILVLR